MIGMDLKLNAAKAGFFDRAKVVNAMNRAAKRALSKFGAFVRQTARTSLRYKDGVSSPGQIPHVHRSKLRKKTNKKTGQAKTQSVSPLRDFIFFSWDDSEKAVVIGPVKLNGTRDNNAPRNLEHGGSAVLPSRGGATRTVKIEPRPFMGPAAAKELPKLSPLWANSLK